MEYLPTCGIYLWQIWVNIPYMEHIWVWFVQLLRDKASSLDDLRALGWPKMETLHECCRMWYRSRWWFQIFFMFTPIWRRFPFWLIFFKWVETTNQRCIIINFLWIRLMPLLQTNKMSLNVIPYHSLCGGFMIHSNHEFAVRDKCSV